MSAFEPPSLRQDVGARVLIQVTEVLAALTGDEALFVDGLAENALGRLEVGGLEGLGKREFLNSAGTNLGNRLGGLPQGLEERALRDVGGGALSDAAPTAQRVLRTAGEGTGFGAGEGTPNANISEGTPDFQEFMARSQTSKNAAALRANMAKNGAKVSPGQQAAHIVPSTESRTPAAVDARDILKRYDIPINDAENGVALSHDQHGGAGQHRFTTYAATYDRLLAVETRALAAGATKAEVRSELVKELRTIASLMKGKKYP
jgi:hypothetical protein